MRAVGPAIKASLVRRRLRRDAGGRWNVEAMDWKADKAEDADANADDMDDEVEATIKNNTRLFQFVTTNIIVRDYYRYEQ